MSGKCDVCGAVLHWSPLVKGLPKVSTVSDCGHTVQMSEEAMTYPITRDRKAQDLPEEALQHGRIRWLVGKAAGIAESVEPIARLEAELAAKDGEIKRLRGDLFELRDVVTAENFAEMQQRAEKAEAQLAQAQEEIKSLEESLEAQSKKFEGCPHPKPVDSYGDPIACGCSYDKASDVCAVHAPLLREAQEKIQRLVRSAEYALRVGYKADDCGDHCGNGCYWCDLRREVALASRAAKEGQ